ncbi:MAG: UDP-N-acetylmuramoyl-tripeptide--D-alanyl-D-alanine ligase [Salinimicrobium sp.]
MEIKKLHKLFQNSCGVSTDTRKIKPDSIFFALKGENFNANDFAIEALEKGASYAIIDEQPRKMKKQLILVHNVLQTLQELATYHRNYLGLPVLALTGSNGKTTTKELINAALSRKYRTTATVGNLNNHIGVPLTLLSMNKKTQIGIVEMGANHQKEIEFLCKIAQPDYGYITNFGKAHLEGFGSEEGVVKGKKELYDFLKEHQKMLFLNMDDPRQKEEKSYVRCYSFGEDPEAELNLKYTKKDNFAGITTEELEVNSNLIGDYNARNLAAAFAIGKFFEVPAEEIKAGLESYTPSNNRSQIIEKNGQNIILDAYNANPTSMAAAIENLDSMDSGSKSVILGDMFELGPLAEEEHQQLVNKISDTSLEHVFLVGENFFKTETPENIRKFKSFDDFREEFDPSETANSLLLIKGSRGMALERVLELL